MTHLECNPQMVKNTSKHGGLRFHESEVQMGLSQSHLLPLPKSFQTAQSSHTRRVSARSAATTANTPSDCSTVQRHKNPRQNPKGRRPTYGLKVILSLTAIWEAAGYPCSARLKALLPLWLPWAQKRFAISAQAQKQLLLISPATIDRRLKPKKRQLKNRLYGRTKPGTLLKHHIPIKTDSWDVKTPGFTETDLVSHSGNSASGEFIHSLNVTDIHSTWVESQRRNGQKPDCCSQCHARALNKRCPLNSLGIDSDNGSEFINYHLKTFCDQKTIQFTRGRPYKKDDNAHIEQKNWTHVRKIFGYLTLRLQPGFKSPSMIFTKTN